MPCLVADKSPGVVVPRCFAILRPIPTELFSNGLQNVHDRYVLISHATYSQYCIVIRLWVVKQLLFSRMRFDLPMPAPEPCRIAELSSQFQPTGFTYPWDFPLEFNLSNCGYCTIWGHVLYLYVRYLKIVYVVVSSWTKLTLSE